MLIKQLQFEFRQKIRLTNRRFCGHIGVIDTAPHKTGDFKGELLGEYKSVSQEEFVDENNQR
jgi:hypothetical protein